jgi:hypothetical protein
MEQNVLTVGKHVSGDAANVPARPRRQSAQRWRTFMPQLYLGHIIAWGVASSLPERKRCTLSFEVAHENAQDTNFCHGITEVQ